MLKNRWHQFMPKLIASITVVTAVTSGIAAINGPSQVLFLSLLMVLLNSSAMTYFSDRSKGRTATYVISTVTPDDAEGHGTVIDLLALASVMIVSVGLLLISARALV